MKIVELVKHDPLADRYGYKYLLVFVPSREEIRYQARVRNWLWEMFGPSAEVTYLNTIYPDEKPAWAWEMNNQLRQIAVNNEAYTMFILNRESLETV